MTVSVLIGNSDNKLSQSEWSLFVTNVSGIVCGYAEQVHFRGGSSFDSQWQNACWVVDIEPSNVDTVCEHLAEVRKRFKQDSVAVCTGETKFV